MCWHSLGQSHPVHSQYFDNCLLNHIMETKLRTAYKTDVTLKKISKLNLGDNIFWVA